MPSFAYTAVNAAGKEVKGSIEAEDEAKASAELKHKGLTVASLKQQNALNKDINLEFNKKPKIRDLSIMCRQFVSMTRAGVSLIETLRMLAEQTENAVLQKALKQVRVDVEKGESLSLAMSRHPKVFPSLLVTMCDAGESSGSIDVSMERMSEQFEKSAHTQALIKKAMIYPAVLIVVIIGVIFLMLLKVIPSFSDMFNELGADLPAITKAMLAASGFLQTYWIAILLLLVAIVVGLKFFGTTDAGKHLYGKIALKIPVLNDLKKKEASSMMARTLSTLIASGVQLPEAVEIVSRTMSNIWYEEALAECKDQITMGVPLSQPLETCGLFPPMVYHMTRIGEESGNTEEMLSKLADYYDEEVEMAVQSLMAAIEPMITIVMALIVGVMVFAIFSPMMSLYDSLSKA